MEDNPVSLQVFSNFLFVSVSYFKPLLSYASYKGLLKLPLLSFKILVHRSVGPGIPLHKLRVSLVISVTNLLFYKRNSVNETLRTLSMTLLYYYHSRYGQNLELFPLFSQAEYYY